jgi:hypothetical protein
MLTHDSVTAIIHAADVRKWGSLASQRIRASRQISGRSLSLALLTIFVSSQMTFGSLIIHVLTWLAISPEKYQPLHP